MPGLPVAGGMRGAGRDTDGARAHLHLARGARGRAGVGREAVAVIQAGYRAGCWRDGWSDADTDAFSVAACDDRERSAAARSLAQGAAP